MIPFHQRSEIYGNTLKQSRTLIIPPQRLNNLPIGSMLNNVHSSQPLQTINITIKYFSKKSFIQTDSLFRSRLCILVSFEIPWKSFRPKMIQSNEATSNYSIALYESPLTLMHYLLSLCYKRYSQMMKNSYQRDITLSFVKCTFKFKEFFHW